MASSMGSLVLDLSANVVKLQSDLGRAVHVAERAANQISRAFGLATAGLSVAGLVSWVKGAIDAADEINKLSVRTGFTTERLSELKLAAELANVPFENLAVAFAKMNDSLVKGSEKTSQVGRLFSELGVDISSGPQKAFDEFTRSVGKLGDTSVQVSALRVVFARTGDALLPMIKSMDDATETARRMGLVMGPEFTAKAEEFKDNLKKLHAASDALAIKWGVEIVGALAEMTKNIANAATATERWKNIFIEFNKILAGTLGWLWPGMDKMAEDYFSMAERAEALTRNRNIIKPIRPFGEQVTGTDTPEALEARLKRLRDILSKSDEMIAAEKKKFASEMEKIQRELSGLLRETAFEEMSRKLGEGGALSEVIKNPKYREALLQKSKELDALRATREESAALGETFTQLGRRIEDADAALASFNETSSRTMQDLEFQAKLIDKTSLEQSTLTAQRAIDLRIEQQVKTMGDDQIEQKIELYRRGDDEKRQIAERIRQNYELARSWDTGVKVAIDEYLETITNAAEMSKQLFTDAFRGMEDALVNFIQHGKLSFHDLAESIINDIVRIYVRSLIMKPIVEAVTASGLGGGIGSFFGGLFGGSTESMAVSAGNSGANEGALLGAFASGTDYVPRTGLALIHQGEAVIPASENVGGSRGGDNYYTTINATDAQSFAAMMASPQGRRVILGSVEMAHQRAGRTSRMAL